MTEQCRKLLKSIAEAETIQDKKAFAMLLAAVLKDGRKPPADRAEFLAYLLPELEALSEDLAACRRYRDHNPIFEYSGTLFDVLMFLYPSANELDPEDLEIVESHAKALDKARYLERETDELFGSEEILERDTEILLNIVANVQDEYQRGMFFAGLLAYRERFPRFDEGSKRLLTDYIAAELDRLVTLLAERDLSDDERTDAEDALEVALDVCRHFYRDGMSDALYRALDLGSHALSHFAIDTLLTVGLNVPKEAVTPIAEDLVCAELCYRMLQKHGRTDLFPEQFSTPVYLAKSDLVHWLTYPTELGKVPDEIEFLGTVKVKRRPFYLFRYRSDSETLGEDLQNVWLISWSDLGGSTFSNFDRYDDFIRKTPEKTLRYIKRKLL